MTGQHRILSTAIVSFFLLLTGGTSASDRQLILIDTDIGTDIDDAFALGLAFGSYELDVRGITTVGDDTHNRAIMLCRFLTVTGRRHTRVAAGAKPQSSRPITDQQKYYYHPDPIFNRTTKPEKQSAVEFLFARLKQHSGQVTVAALGPLTNLARLIETHADATKLIHRIVLLEKNISLDVVAARKVFASGVPLLVISEAASSGLQLDDAGVKQVFRPGTPLTRQVETMYQMWDRHHPPLGESLAIAMCFDEQLAGIQSQNVAVDDQGKLTERDGAKSNARVVKSVKPREFANWYVARMSSLVAPQDAPSRVIPDNTMPLRVHVAEDFDNDIERFWWMSGKAETDVLPTGSKRACRGVLTHDFDDLLMQSRQMYSAVIFNPVPGPPMGKNTRLRFRYWLKDTDSIRVQIYSLTNGYHRQLVVKGLPQKKWQLATVDMTEARRPDGTGGPLGENERIDDIQFYIDPNAQILIDDVVLYDAGGKDQRQPFPGRILFTGIFDTGKQGQHWPGDFALVPDAGNFWRAVQSVENPETGKPWIRLGLRGLRRVGPKTQVSFRYQAMGAKAIQVEVLNSKSGEVQSAMATELEPDRWSSKTVEFATSELTAIDELRFILPKDATLRLDDVLIFEPGE